MNIRKQTKCDRAKEITGILAIHELKSLFFVPKPSPIIILAPRQVMPEHLRIEVRIDGHRRRRSLPGGASDGDRFPALEDSGPRREEVGPCSETTRLQRNRHG